MYSTDGFTLSEVVYMPENYAFMQLHTLNNAKSCHTSNRFTQFCSAPHTKPSYSFRHHGKHCINRTLNNTSTNNP